MKQAMQRAVAKRLKVPKLAKAPKAPKLYRYKGCGLDNVYLEGGVEYVQTPRGWVLRIEDMDGLHRAIGRSLVHEKKNLTGKEFRFLRHEINLTLQNLAAILNTDVQNIGRWEREEVDKIPGPAQGLIRLLYDEKINGNTEVIKSLERLAELDEQMGADEDMTFEPGPEGWSIAA
jgi:DNA-binding transcriptional regulator YiaG